MNSVVSIGLLTAITIIGLPHGVIAQTIPQPLLSEGKIPENAPPVNERQGGTRTLTPLHSWWDIFKNNPPVDEKAGGPRENLCLIAPRSLNTNTEVWSDRPLLIWQGKLSGIGIRPVGSDQILWSQTVAAKDGDLHISYSGEPLQSGQMYQWVIFDSQNQPLLSIPFKVMDDEERDRIRVRLRILGQELKEQGATSEEMAWARANYFAQMGLWSDVLQEVYSVENPSETLQEIIQEIPAKLCSPRGVLR